MISSRRFTRAWFVSFHSYRNLTEFGSFEETQPLIIVRLKCNYIEYENFAKNIRPFSKQFTTMRTNHMSAKKLNLNLFYIP